MITAPQLEDLAPGIGVRRSLTLRPSPQVKVVVARFPGPSLSTSVDSEFF